MNSLLHVGQLLHGTNTLYRVGKLLGSGSQGEVYEATANGQVYAIKWYFSQMATKEQLAGIQRLVKIGPPNSSFLWPLELITTSSKKGFGYVMPLRPKRFASIVDLMKRKADPSFYALTRAAMELIESFRMLHAKQLCYRDISFGNLFFDPQTGEVLICDNDNIAFEQEVNTTVLGTPRFMAPEIVRGESLPDVDTDRFSIAVLLFYMFMIHHPLEGRLEASIKCFDLPAMRQLYGHKPLFIFDPISSANRPLPGLHDNALIYWNLYPDYFKQLFTQCFTKGLRQRQHRPDEAQWLEVLLKLQQSIVSCTCSAENFYDHNKTCWSCQKSMLLPLHLHLNGSLVVLREDTRLYQHQLQMHLPNKSTISLSKTHRAAKVTKHPHHPEIRGLQNLTEESWQVTTPKGHTFEVPKGRSVTLEPGAKINFGQVSGIVQGGFAHEQSLGLTKEATR